MSVKVSLEIGVTVGRSLKLMHVDTDVEPRVNAVKVVIQSIFCHQRLPTKETVTEC